MPRPIPAISIDRRVPEPFESKWLSWIGPWSFHSFIGQMEDERDPTIDYPNHYLWGMRGEVRPAIIEGLEIGFFRILQLGGEGRTKSLNMWIDAFLSQDNETDTEQPGNQLAGIDLRWTISNQPIALYCQVVGEDEEKFFSRSTFFQYGIEGWKNLSNSTLRVFVEYSDLTTYWWTGDPRTRNITYGHHIYGEGYRHFGRPIGHWSDQDSQTISVGALIQSFNGIGWVLHSRAGDLNSSPLENEPPHNGFFGSNSISNEVTTEYFSCEIFNARQYPNFNLSVYTLLGWESLKPENLSQNFGFSSFLCLVKSF